MDHLDRLAEKLRAVDFDRSRLSDTDHTEVFNLARAAQIELWISGVVWPSSPGAEDRGGALTPIDARRL